MKQNFLVRSFHRLLDLDVCVDHDNALKISRLAPNVRFLRLDFVNVRRKRFFFREIRSLTLGLSQGRDERLPLSLEHLEKLTLNSSTNTHTIFDLEECKRLNTVEIEMFPTGEITNAPLVQNLIISRGGSIDVDSVAESFPNITHLRVHYLPHWAWGRFPQLTCLEAEDSDYEWRPIAYDFGAFAQLR